MKKFLFFRALGGIAPRVHCGTGLEYLLNLLTVSMSIEYARDASLDLRAQPGIT